MTYVRKFDDGLAQNMTPYALMSQAECARRMGISKQAVQQAERSALLKIRRRWREIKARHPLETKTI